MPDDIKIVSTTDSQEAVNVAAGLPANAGKERDDDIDDELEVETEPSEKAASTAAVETKSESETDNPEGQESKKGRNGRYKKRIATLQAELAQERADRRRDSEERERQAKEREKAPAANPPETKTVATNSDRPKAEDFKTLEEWVEAVADWKAEQRDQSKEAKAKKAAAEEQEKHQTASAEAVKATFKERVIAFKEDHPDYDEKIQTGWHPIPDACYNSMLEMENGAEVAYHLAQHPEIADKLMETGKKSVLRAIAEIWKVSESLANATPPPKKRSNAPPPPSTVNGAATRSSVPLDEMNYEEFKVARAAGRIH